MNKSHLYIYIKVFPCLYTWKKYMASTPAAAKMQKALSAGRTVRAPTPNAMTSVAEVTVMATPACCRVSPTRAGSEGRRRGGRTPARSSSSSSSSSS